MKSNKSSTAKTITGLVLMVIGILLGLYVGVWVFFIGGIAGLINIVSGAIDGVGINGLDVAICIAKIMFASLIGYLSCMVIFLPGYVMFKKS